MLNFGLGCCAPLIDEVGDSRSSNETFIDQ